MTPIWAWARRELTRHRRAALALVLLIGISGAVVLTTAAGARRSASAYDRFLETSHTADVQLQYGAAEGRQDPALDAEVLEALRADPAVDKAVPLYITCRLRRRDATTTSACSRGRTLRCSRRSMSPASSRVGGPTRPTPTRR